MRAATAAAALAGALGAWSAAAAVETGLELARRRAAPGFERGPGRLDLLLAPLRRAGAQGVRATERERLRLALAAGVAGLAAGLIAAGPWAGLALAAAGALGSLRAAATRRARYARRLDAGAAAAASAIADALGAGHAPRAALGEAAAALEGPIALELARTARELELGSTTAAALSRLRERAGSRRVDLIAAAIRLQRRSGGNLAALMRQIARAAEGQAHMEADVRAATAQARFTSLTVVAMGPCGLVLAELAAPGTLGRMAGSPIALVMLACAGGLQIGATLVVRRLAKVDT